MLKNVYWWTLSFSKAFPRTFGSESIGCAFLFHSFFIHPSIRPSCCAMLSLQMGNKFVQRLVQQLSFQLFHTQTLNACLHFRNEYFIERVRKGNDMLECACVWYMCVKCISHRCVYRCICTSTYEIPTASEFK